MEAEIFKDIIVPVIGGLGLFMLGLEFMTDGIQAMAVNRMRGLLAKLAGTPIKGLLAGTVITGVIQSSTAMTVMVVGLVNSGVLGLRAAISVIMGANIGTTLTNTLIALPLGLYGLLFGGIAALIMVFSKRESTRNVMLSVLGFCLIFYGLNMMTGGLKPLRGMPEVMAVISSVNADGYLGVLYCVFIAAVTTALIHSSSATIGIVMGLGASGVIGWEAALAFSLGADLGTTITSFIASLNLSKNAKRTAYAHIAFNFIGVGLMLPLFPLGVWLVKQTLGDPGTPKLVNGAETFPLVPIAVGVYSTAFNVFNAAVLFPFIGVFERVLSKVGRDESEDVEDYSVPKFLVPSLRADLSKAVPAVQREIVRHLDCSSLFLAIARGTPGAPKDLKQHQASTDVLGRDIRKFASSLFTADLPYAKADLIASLVEEADFTSSLGDSLHQIARRVQREKFGNSARELVNQMLDATSDAMRAVQSSATETSAEIEKRSPLLLQLRERALRTNDITASERGAVVALLGSVERVFQQIDRIIAERMSVDRTVPASFAPALAPAREPHIVPDPA